MIENKVMATQWDKALIDDLVALIQHPLNIAVEQDLQNLLNLTYQFYNKETGDVWKSLYDKVIPNNTYRVRE